MTKTPNNKRVMPSFEPTWSEAFAMPSFALCPAWLHANTVGSLHNLGIKSHYATPIMHIPYLTAYEDKPRPYFSKGIVREMKMEIRGFGLTLI